MSYLLTTFLLLPSQEMPASDEAIGSAQSHHRAPLAQIEETILGDRPVEGLALLGDHRAALSADADPRVLRLRLLAQVKLGESLKVQRLARRLAAIPGWKNFAADYLNWRSSRPGPFGVWLTLYALAMAVFLLGGGRELLRPHVESMIVLFVTVVFLVEARVSHDEWRLGLGLVFAAIWALTHGAVATMARNQPGVRARVLLMVVLVAGAIGVVGATVERLLEI